MLAEQLSSALLEEDDERLPRAAVSQRWQATSGGLAAALSYAVLSRPSPSQPPAEEWEPDPRARLHQRLLAEDERPNRRTRANYSV